MRILIAPVDMAGQAELLARNLRLQGHQATLCAYNRNPFGFGCDQVVRRPHMPSWFDDHWQEYDIFHYYWGKTMKDDLSDLSTLTRHGKKVLMRHCGNDLRLLSMARRKNPYVRILYPNNLKEQDIAANLKNLSKVIDHAIVPDYELQEHAALFYERVHVIPRAIELSNYPPEFPEWEKDRPLVVHASSLPYFKGTGDVIDTVHELQKRHDFDFQLVEKKTHQEALQIYRQADIAIDQLLIGSHGVFAVEAMALGKPVISYIREDLQDTFPKGFPIVSASPATLYEQLEWLLSQPAKRRELGIKGRQYAERVHDHRKVLAKTIELYHSM